jgi:signal transduction histidine kinase
VLGAGWLGNLAWPLVIGVAGVALIWRNASADEQIMLRRLAEPLLGRPRPGKRTATVLRASAAAVLLAGGLAILLVGHDGAELLLPLGGLILVVAAIVVILGPWWLRIALDLVAERQARARAEERADMAARVHDSVLQTLALIQRNADQPAQVVKLARGQERELRSWLFGGSAPGGVRGQGTTLAAGVRLIQQEVEARHGVAVEAVTVGDCGLDDHLDALLAAAREATVNAAKWSGADVISVFAEVEPAEVSVFVRDRGCGFDPAAVPSDRKGLAESVRARMRRRGGSVTVRSVVGNGTEISLRMPRVAGPRQPSRA